MCEAFFGNQCVRPQVRVEEEDGDGLRFLSSVLAPADSYRPPAAWWRRV